MNREGAMVAEGRKAGTMEDFLDEAKRGVAEVGEVDAEMGEEFFAEGNKGNNGRGGGLGAGERLFRCLGLK